MKAFVFALIIIFMIGLPKLTLAKVTSEGEFDRQLTELGKGSFRWWGIKVYDARLLVNEEFDGNYFYNRPLTLEIQYDIDIDSEDLVETTREEWEELSISQTDWCRDREQWLTQLSQLWPDLKQGDKLRHEINVQGESVFYFNDQRLGEIKDINFGPCFLSIWLASDTSAPGLRKNLLALKSQKGR